MMSAWRFAILTAVASIIAGRLSYADPQKPFPQHVGYPGAALSVSSRTQPQMDDEVAAYHVTWKSRYLVDAGEDGTGHDMLRVAHERSPEPDTVSEGQGYGMVITALMAGADPNAQSDFNAMWHYVKAHPSSVNPHLMDWHQPADMASEPNDDDSAFDGDCDIAYSLLLASAQWGDGGAINYGSEAATMIDAIGDATVGPNSRLPQLGDWVLDSPSGKFNEYSVRTSDFMITNFRAFHSATSDTLWLDVVNACQSVSKSIATDFAPDTGLLPDFIVRKKKKGVFRMMPAHGKLIETRLDGTYGFNACRDPWRFGMDGLMTNDATSTLLARRMSQFVRASCQNDPPALHAGYKLDGKPANKSAYFSGAFAAPLAVAARLEGAEAQSWLNALYAAAAANDDNYYEDTLSLLALLVLSNNWWTP